VNIGESNDVNVLITHLIGRRSDRSETWPMPTVEEVLAAAERLAGKAFKATYAGWTAERVRAAWLNRPQAGAMSPAEAEAAMLAGFGGTPQEGGRVGAAARTASAHALLAQVAGWAFSADEPFGWSPAGILDEIREVLREAGYQPEGRAS
jgi:hypothetical protein